MPSILKIKIICGRQFKPLAIESKIGEKFDSISFITQIILNQQRKFAKNLRKASLSNYKTEYEDEILSDNDDLEGNLKTSTASLLTMRTKAVKMASNSKSFDPRWDEDFRLEISDDSCLQDMPLELEIFYSQTDAGKKQQINSKTNDLKEFEKINLLGKVLLDMNPLITRDSPYEINGWFPLIGAEGIMGEIQLQAKVQFFGDINPFKDSSAEIQFYSINEIPKTVKVKNTNVRA